ncbi:MAG: hypothetical protein QNL85_00650 [Euryarchaeota archaeon]
MHMQPDPQERKFWGQVEQSPDPVALQHQSQAGTIVQPIQTEQHVVPLAVPKFKHMSRVASTVLFLTGFLIYFVAFYFEVLDGDGEIMAGGELMCCLFFNTALVFEIIFYLKMLEHNDTYQTGKTWTVVNIVVVGTVTMAGMFYLVLLLSGASF